MAGMLSVSRTNLAQRRKKLRRRRQVKIIQTVWRTFTIASLAGGLLWIAIQPMWVLKTPKDITISGNKLFPDESIQSLIDLPYPQFLLRVKPSQVTQTLQKQPIIIQAKVSRRLFPPGLQVQITERIPVALAQLPKLPGKKNQPAPVGLIDVTGLWIPLKQYTSHNPRLQLPKLKIIGLPKKYRPFWTQLYQSIQQSQIQITEIDFQDQTNLILKTELGKVHLGAPSSKLPEQIKILPQLRQLSVQVPPQGIDYIDLKNPREPVVQMNLKKQSIDRKRQNSNK